MVLECLFKPNELVLGTSRGEVIPVDGQGQSTLLVVEDAWGCFSGSEPRGLESPGVLLSPVLCRVPGALQGQVQLRHHILSWEPVLHGKLDEYRPPRRRLEIHSLDIHQEDSIV